VLLTPGVGFDVDNVAVLGEAVLRSTRLNQTSRLSRAIDQANTLAARAHHDAIRRTPTGVWRAAGHRDGTGTGLRNLEERLATTLPGRARLTVGEDDGWDRAVIMLPGVARGCARYLGSRH